MKILRQLFSKQTNNWGELKERIEYAFTLNGTDYFKFKDEMGMATQRAMATLAFYEELRQKCTREYLVAFTESLSKEIETAKDQMKVDGSTLNLNHLNNNLNQIAKCNNFLKERLELIIDQDAAYKLASVVYFTKDERPDDYDYQYNLDFKIPEFKRYGTSFFLQKPLKELIPFGDMSETDIRDYLKVEKKMTSHQLDTLLSGLSEDFKKSKHYKQLISLMSLDSQEKK